MVCSMPPFKDTASPWPELGHVSCEEARRCFSAAVCPVNCRARTGEEGGRTSRDGRQCRPCLVSHFFHSFAFPFPLCVGVPQNSVSSPVLSNLLLGRYHTAPCPDAVTFAGVTVRKHFEPRKGKADLPGLPRGR